MKSGIIHFFLFASLCCCAATQKKQLLDFKPAKTPWLKQYPVIQKEIKKIIEENKEGIAKDAEELLQEFPKTALLPYKFHVEELKQFKPYNQDIVSVRMLTYTYTGGAHGGRNYYSWNWSKTKKKFLSLDEVITPKQFTFIVKQARDNLFKQQKQDDEYDKHRKMHIQRGTSKKEDFKIWNLDRKGFVFVFPEYQVASYAAGSFEVYFFLDSLK